MSQAGPDDSKRRFVVSYYMADNTISIYEPPVSNSGFTGGKFLDRNRVRKHGTAKHDCAWMSQGDLLVDLPGSVFINNYPFVLLECDRFTLRYRNKGSIAALLSIDHVHAKLGVNLSDVKGLVYGFMEKDPEDTGHVWLDDFVMVLPKPETLARALVAPTIGLIVWVL
ncbi:hypothetical protein T484DRAFT_3261091 [Baffinella frigidus]|nr:hypothetical protein T484DRAFT_3261091 [Cryptophyta sp. CCMP2293]